MANKGPPGLNIGLAPVRAVARATVAVGPGAEDIAEVRFRRLEGWQIRSYSEVPHSVDRVEVLKNAVEVAGIPEIGKPDRQIQVHGFTRALGCRAWGTGRVNAGRRQL